MQYNVILREFNENSRQKGKVSNVALARRCDLTEKYFLLGQEARKVK